MITMPTIRIYKEHRLQEYLELRHEVFVKEQGVDPHIEHDEYDTLNRDDVIHFAYWHDKILVATARVLIKDERTVQFGRIATLKEFRNQGYASRLLRDLEVYCHNIGYEVAIVNSQTDVINFYTLNNYHPVGERFMEAGIEHQTMTKFIGTK